MANGLIDESELKAVLITENFVPYDKLSEEKKELDREWANKVLALLRQEKVLSMDGTTGKGGEWIATDMLKPKKKKDILNMI